MKSICYVIINSVFSFAARREVLPRSHDVAKIFLFSMLIVKSIKTTVLGFNLLIKFFNIVFLIINGLQHLRNFIIATA